MKTVRINDLVKRNKQILRRRKVIEKKLKELQQEDNELLKELERNNNFFVKSIEQFNWEIPENKLQKALEYSYDELYKFKLEENRREKD